MCRAISVIKKKNKVLACAPTRMHLGNILNERHQKEKTIY